MLKILSSNYHCINTITRFFFDWLILIQPIGHFQNDSPVSGSPASGNIIIGVYHKNIGYRLVTPLKSHIYIHVVHLFVVLHKRRPEDFIGKRYIEFGPNQP